MSLCRLPLRGTRGAERVRLALGLEAPLDPATIILACQAIDVGRDSAFAGPSIGAASLGRPSVRIRVSEQPSRVRPQARGRYAAGVVTLFPRAFADPLTLAYTLLHELAHAAGLAEEHAHGFASRWLFGAGACEGSLHHAEDRVSSL